jgi:hypothetical protein
VADVCQTDPTCCNTDWDATCVALVDTECGIVRCEQGGSTCGTAVDIDYHETQVLLGTLVGQSSSGCTSQGNSCGNAATWYSVTAPYGTDAIRWGWTCGSDFAFGLDSVLSIHTGCPGEVGNEFTSNDDWRWNSPNSSACGAHRPTRWLDSVIFVPFTVPGGHTYKIRLSHSSAVGPTPEGHYQFYLPEPSSALLGGVGLATVFALSRWRSRRRGRVGSG